jgi:hypothetical protein
MTDQPSAFLKTIFPVIDANTTIDSLGKDILDEIKLLCLAWKILLTEGAIPTKPTKMLSKFGPWCDTFVIGKGSESSNEILRNSYSPSALMTIWNRLNCTTSNSVIDENGIRETPVIFFENNYAKMMEIMNMKLGDNSKRIRKLQVLEDMFYEIAKVVGPFPIGKALIWLQMMYNQIRPSVDKREITVEEIAKHMLIVDPFAGWGCRMFSCMLFKNYIIDQLEITDYEDADIKRFRDLKCYVGFDTNQSMKPNYELQKSIYLEEFSLGTDCAEIHIMNCELPEALEIMAQNGGTALTSSPTPQEIYAENTEALNPGDSYREHYMKTGLWTKEFLIPLYQKMLNAGVYRILDAVDGYTEVIGGKRKFVKVVDEIKKAFPDAKTCMYVGSTAYESCEAIPHCRSCKRGKNCGKCKSCRKTTEKLLCSCKKKGCRFCMANPKPTICFENACKSCQKTQVLRTIVMIDRSHTTE